MRLLAHVARAWPRHPLFTCDSYRPPWVCLYLVGELPHQWPAVPRACPSGLRLQHLHLSPPISVSPFYCDPSACTWLSLPHVLFQLLPPFPAPPPVCLSGFKSEVLPLTFHENVFVTVDLTLLSGQLPGSRLLHLPPWCRSLASSRLVFCRCLCRYCASSSLGVVESSGSRQPSRGLCALSPTPASSQAPP